MIDESVCSVCARPTGFGDEDKGEPPVNLARCPSPGSMECRAVAQAVAPWRRENETLRANCDHLSSENASLASQVESMAMRIESLAEELAKPEDVRLREVVDALDGRAVIFDGLGVRVTHLLDEMDEWIARAGDAERRLEDADAKLTAVRVALTESGVPEVDPYPEEDVSDHEKSLRAGGRVIGAVARIERLAARLAAAGDVVKMARQLVSYEWEARLDDSKVSDAAKHDARELSYAVYEYDRTAKPWTLEEYDASWPRRQRVAHNPHVARVVATIEALEAERAKVVKAVEGLRWWQEAYLRWEQGVVAIAFNDEDWARWSEVTGLAQRPTVVLEKAGAK